MSERVTVHKGEDTADVPFGCCRIDCLRRHIEQMREAAEDGVKVIGYTPWDCIDLVSASAEA